MAGNLFPFDNSYASLPDRFFIRQSPAPVHKPELIRLNVPMCTTLGMKPELFDEDAGAAIFSGNRVPDGAEPIAMAYAGHQFGGWVPRLGDGRAILLGEIVGMDGVRRDIQLKGSGPTPFSRNGDGRAPLGPILREYVVSEGMHALGVPTTRALAAVKTGEYVVRESFLPGAILTRVAQSHVRVGTFEFFYGQGDHDGLRTLADYVIERHYPDSVNAEHPYEELLINIIRRQASLVAKWLSLGFIHGVMNTDNTAITGETIDYGPCAFMDGYSPKAVFSSIDQMGRYAYCNQPSITNWNMAQLARCLVPIMDDDAERGNYRAQGAIDRFSEVFNNEFTTIMRGKLGLHDAEDDDLGLALDLFKIMDEVKADFTNTFRALADIIGGQMIEETPVGEEFKNRQVFKDWLVRWHERLDREDSSPAERKAMMQAVNPSVIPRNHLVEAAIRAAEDDNDFNPFHKLVDAVSRPFEGRMDDSIFTRSPTPEELVCQTFCGT